MKKYPNVAKFGDRAGGERITKTASCRSCEESIFSNKEAPTPYWVDRVIYFKREHKYHRKRNDLTQSYLDNSDNLAEHYSNSD